MKENIAEDKWLMSSFIFGAKPKKIDKEIGMMSGVYICTEGEALGHGVNLDSEFIANVIKMGNEKKQGLKVRFGHPNMSSTALGTFLGRAKNFKAGKMPDGSSVAIADVFLSNSAKEAPQGNLYDYVLSLADEDAKAFGMSIVFSNGGIYRRDKEGNKQYRYTSEGERNKKYDDAEESLREPGAGDHVLDLGEDLGPGMYFVRLRQNEVQAMAKVASLR